MKNSHTFPFFVAILCLIACPSAADAEIVLLFENFEGGSGQFSTPDGTGSDGDEDYFAVVNNSNTDRSYTNVQGTNYFGAQDINDSDAIGKTPGRVLFEDIDISGKTGLSFSAYFAEQRPEAGGDDDIDASDFALIEYQIDNGGFQNLLGFQNDGTTFNTTFLEDTNFDGTGDGSQLETEFAQFTKGIAGTGSLLDLRFTISVDSGDEDFAFDSVKVTAVPEPTSLLLFGSLAGVFCLRRRRK